MQTTVSASAISICHSDMILLCDCSVVYRDSERLRCICHGRCRSSIPAALWHPVASHYCADEPDAAFEDAHWGIPPSKIEILNRDGTREIGESAVLQPFRWLGACFVPLLLLCHSPYIYNWCLGGRCRRLDCLQIIHNSIIHKVLKRCLTSTCDITHLSAGLQRQIRRH